MENPSLAHAIGVNLRRLMQEKHIKIQDITALTGKGRRTVQRWLAGEYPPTITDLTMLAVYFGETPASLMKTVTRDWSKFEGSTLKACRVAMSADSLIRPNTGILYDYLVLGVWIPDTIVTSFLNALRTHKYGTERLYIEGGKILADNKKVGSVHRSRGRSWDGKKKVLFHFTGSFFRPIINGGADMTVQHAWLFLMQTLIDVQEMARTASGEQSKAGDSLTHYDTAEEMHTKRLSRARSMVHSEYADVSHQVREYVDLMDTDDEIREKMRTEMYPVRWGDLVEWPAREIVVERMDVCIEVEIDPCINIMDFRNSTANLPKGWYWRETRTSEDGETLYAGTSKYPLKNRGEKPLLAVYRETKRPNILRCEVRVPRVTYHTAKGEYGIIKAAELIADIFDHFLPWSVQVDKLNEFYGDKRMLSVPLLELGSKPCVRHIATKEIPKRAFSGHDAGEIKRQTNQGATCLRRSLGSSILASRNARKPRECVVNGFAESLNLDGVLVSINLPAHMQRCKEYPNRCDNNADRCFYGSRRMKEPGRANARGIHQWCRWRYVRAEFTYVSKAMSQPAMMNPPKEPALSMEQWRCTEPHELLPHNVLTLDEIDELHCYLDGYKREFHPGAKTWTPKPFEMSEDVVEAFLGRLLKEQHVPDWLGKHEPSVVLDARGYWDACDADQAKLVLGVYDGERFETITMEK